MGRFVPAPQCLGLHPEDKDSQGAGALGPLTSTWALHVGSHVESALWPESHMLTPGPQRASCEREQEHVPWGEAVSRCDPVPGE